MDSPRGHVIVSRRRFSVGPGTAEGMGTEGQAPQSRPSRRDFIHDPETHPRVSVSRVSLRAVRASDTLPAQKRVAVDFLPPSLSLSLFLRVSPVGLTRSHKPRGT